MRKSSKAEPVLIKLYAQRRLYDTGKRRRYVTVEELGGRLVRCVSFSAIEAETGVDVTRVLVA
jgi:polyhydroxyalkanoate synthesis regulator protein